MGSEKKELSKGDKVFMGILVIWVVLFLWLGPAVVTWAFTSQSWETHVAARDEEWRACAIGARVAEYYLDANHQRQFRWLSPNQRKEGE